MKGNSIITAREFEKLYRKCRSGADVAEAIEEFYATASSLGAAVDIQLKQSTMGFKSSTRELCIELQQSGVSTPSFEYSSGSSLLPWLFP